MTWRGRYFDGRSAARCEAEIAIVPAALHIRPDNGGTVVWPFDRLRWVEPPAASGEARLALDHGAARLDVDDPGFIAALRGSWPDIDHAAAKHERRGRAAIIVTASVAGAAALIYAAAAVLPGMITPLVPASVERSMGDAMVEQIVGLFGAMEGQKSRLCDGREGRAALDRLLARLAPDSGYKVTVANMRMVNALAAPGGHIVMFRGLIKFAKTPEEFAGVLAHEIGHAVHRHPTRAVIREIGLGATLDLLTGSAGGQGFAGTAANLLVRTTYSRDAEREADEAAGALLKRAGIRTGGLITLFERFADKETDLPPSMQLFSTHPRSEDRASRIRDQGGTDAGPAMPAAEWRAIKAMCGKG